jgi:hypothetical protein
MTPVHYPGLVCDRYYEQDDRRPNRPGSDEISGETHFISTGATIVIVSLEIRARAVAKRRAATADARSCRAGRSRRTLIKVSIGSSG